MNLKTVLSIFLLLLILAAGCVKQRHAPLESKIKKAVGPVFLQRPETKEKIRVVQGSTILSEDFLSTESLGKAHFGVLAWGDFFLNQESRIKFKFPKYAEDSIVLIGLQNGEIFSLVSPLKSKGKFLVQTALAQILTQGTDFYVGVDAKKQMTQVAVYNGSVKVTILATREVKIVEEGNVLEFKSAQTLPELRPILREEMNSLKTWIDGEVINRILSPYVLMLNFPPEFTSIPSKTIWLGQRYQYDIKAQDSNGDTLFYRLLKAPAYMRIQEKTGRLTWVPVKSGKELVQIQAQDGKGGEAVQSFWIQVKEKGVGEIPTSVAPIPNHPPEAIFNVSPVKGAPLTEFILDASGVQDEEDATDQLQVRWDVTSDGQWETGFLNDKIYKIRYERSGNYEVTLEVKDSRGASQQYKEKVSVSEPCRANAGADRKIFIFEKVRFRGEAEDPDNMLIRFDWDFEGDGQVDSSATMPQEYHPIYNKPGIYTAVFTVYSEDGSSASDQVKVTVDAHPPRVVLGKQKERTGRVNLPIPFYGIGYDKYGKIVKYEWDFDGNGQYDWSSPDSGRSAYTYTQSGVYTAYFRVTNNYEQTHTDSLRVEVVNSLPRARAGEDRFVQSEENVKLQGLGEDSDGRIILYEWDFEGDGIFDWQSKENGEVKHRFAEWVQPVLRVTDNDGVKALDTVKIVICSEGMRPVQNGPLKYCMDIYEWPNQKEYVPQTNVTYSQAQELCEGVGKRLCSLEMWQGACASNKKFRFPYGVEFKNEYCNSYGNRGKAAPSGDFFNCKSQFGIYDMSGNVWEWTDQSVSQGDQIVRVTSGGSWHDKQSRVDCFSTQVRSPKDKFPFLGFRCCK